LFRSGPEFHPGTDPVSRAGRASLGFLFKYALQDADHLVDFGAACDKRRNEPQNGIVSAIYYGAPLQAFGNKFRAGDSQFQTHHETSPSDAFYERIALLDLFKP